MLQQVMLFSTAKKSALFHSRVVMLNTYIATVDGISRLASIPYKPSNKVEGLNAVHIK